MPGKERLKKITEAEFPTVPSVGDTVNTCSWLSDVLKRELEGDLASDHDSVLRNADIE